MNTRFIMIKKHIKYIIPWGILCQLLVPSISYSLDIDRYAILNELIKTMSIVDHYPEEELIKILNQAKINQHVITLMNRQHEAVPWYQYQKKFINPTRINDGVNFLKVHQATLDRANKQFGIPRSILVAVIGIETDYGKYIGDYKVLDSLLTLSVKFPRRRQFFFNELRTFLNMTRSEKIDPFSVIGSFAGAIGIPQFMPTSYQSYAIDFNNNNKKDLMNEVDDAIGSIANYLSIHGWITEQSLYANVDHPLSNEAKYMVSHRAKPTLSHEQLSEAGLVYNKDHASSKTSLLLFKEKNQNRYVIGYHNFYVITRYNHDMNYAMVIAKLSEAIKSNFN